MFQDLNVFKTAHAMATHAGHRHSVIARNMANADTPGYRARDIRPFAETFAQSQTGAEMRATRRAHLHGHGEAAMAATLYTPDLPADPNGNTVSIEEQMLNAVEVKRQHDRALTIYKSALSVLRTSLGRS